MEKLAHAPGWVFKLMLVAATVIWGLSFIVMKDAVDVIPPAYLLGFRFLATGVLLAVVFHKHVARAFTREDLKCGLVLGVLNFLAFWLQTVGLVDTTPGKNAFITATYCVIVPFAWWVVARKRPTVFNIGAAVLSVAGIGLVSLQGSLGELAMGFGDFMTLLCAFVFAIDIVFVSKYSQNHDVLALTVYQFLTGGVLGFAVGACTETLPPVSVITPDFLLGIAYLVVFASCVALVFQNVALEHVPPAQASLFLSLESVFGVVFSVLLYGEQMTLRLVVGFALIFVAIVISETFPLKEKSHGREE